MPQVIDLEGLPQPVADAIVATVLNLRNSYRVDSPQNHEDRIQKELPSRSGTVIGDLRRVDIYDER